MPFLCFSLEQWACCRGVVWESKVHRNSRKQGARLTDWWRPCHVITPICKGRWRKCSRPMIVWNNLEKSLLSDHSGFGCIKVACGNELQVSEGWTMSSKGRKIAKNLGKSLRKKFDSDSQTDDLQQVGKPTPWHVKNLPVQSDWCMIWYGISSVIVHFCSKRTSNLCV